MNKGSCRRLTGPLTGGLLFLGLSLALGTASVRARTDEGPDWWEVRLLVSVKGEYRISDRAKGAPVAGDYFFRARWVGRLEPDEDDFLLVHLRTEVLEWRLSEKAGAPGREAGAEVPDTPAPDLRLNYVLRDGKSLEFDFVLDGTLSVPLHDHPVKARLDLPRSATPPDGLPGTHYDDDVFRGSNRVVIPAEDLGKRKAERGFSWEWARAVPLADPRYGFSNSHAVEAVVALAMR
jgi:hypothetical protein